MFGSLVRRQHRREANVRAFHQFAPLGAGTAGEQLGEMLMLLGPTAAIPLAGEARITLQAELLQQQRVELRLDRTQADKPAIGTTVGGIKRRTVVDVLATLIGYVAGVSCRQH
ncbi:hypothetical protein D3C76_1606010 [compost metagenome]